MKKFLIFTLCLSIFYGCSEPEANVEYDSTSVKFNSAILTKATDTQFELGDVIYVSSYADGVSKDTNVSYTFGSDEIFSATTTPISKEETASLSYLALYPVSNDGSIFTVKSDQSSGSNYTLSDLMSSTAEATTSLQPVLIFDHLMTKISLSITTDVELQGATIWAKGSVTYDADSNSVETTGDFSTITMRPLADGGYDAIIAPQTISDMTIVITDINGEEYLVAYDNVTETLPGYVYTATVTIADKAVTIEGVDYSSDINDWQDGDLLDGDSTQTLSYSIEFFSTEALTAAAEGETFTLDVDTNLESWLLCSSNDDVEISEPDYENSQVTIKICKYGAFSGSRTINLSLESDDGLTTSTTDIEVTQSAYNSTSSFTDAFLAGTATYSDGKLTLTHTSTFNSRLYSTSYGVGFGTYTIDIDSFTSNHASNPFFVIYVDDTAAGAYDRYIMKVGTDPSSVSASHMSVLKINGTVLNNSFFCDGADLTKCTRLVLSVLPDESAGTITMSVRLDYSDGSEYTFEHSEYWAYSTLLDSATGFTYSTVLDSYLNAHNMVLYFGIGCNSAPSGTTNTVVISSFEFEPYTAE